MLEVLLQNECQANCGRSSRILESENHVLLVSGLLVMAVIFWLFKDILNLFVNML